MKRLITIISFTCLIVCMLSCNHTPSADEETTSYQSATDTELAEFINKVKAVDNHIFKKHKWRRAIA